MVVARRVTVPVPVVLLRDTMAGMTGGADVPDAVETDDADEVDPMAWVTVCDSVMEDVAVPLAMTPAEVEVETLVERVVKPAGGSTPESSEGMTVVNM